MSGDAMTDDAVREMTAFAERYLSLTLQPWQVRAIQQFAEGAEWRAEMRQFQPAALPSPASPHLVGPDQGSKEDTT